jgi:hypothetical protein
MRKSERADPVGLQQILRSQPILFLLEVNSTAIDPGQKVLGVKAQHHVQVQLGHHKVFVFNMFYSLVTMSAYGCAQVFPQNKQRLQNREK